MPKSPQINIKGKSYNDLHNMGARSYLAKDYTEAVFYFSKASELGVEKLGDQLHDELADVYLLYGKSLLELARMEGDPFGENVPKEVVVGEEEAEEDCAGEEDKKVEKDAEKTPDAEAEPVGKEEDEDEEDLNGEEDDEEEDEENDEQDNSKNEGIELNGEEINSTSQNKEKEESGEEGGAKSQEEEEEDPSDLQLAWEILELAKLIYTKRGDGGKKFLADTLITLGEISMESENIQSAINDIKEAVTVLGTLDDKNNRMLAEAFYKLGMAVAMENKLEEAIVYYNKSKQVLENRIKDLEGSEREVHKMEVNEMKNILPEIEEKVVDLRNFKEEQTKRLEEPSSVVTDDSKKKPNNISHLVKHKRTLEPEDADCSSPPKKPALE